MKPVWAKSSVNLKPVSDGKYSEKWSNGSDVHIPDYFEMYMLPAVLSYTNTNTHTHTLLKPELYTRLSLKISV
jgi:hypothetical protein